MTEFNREERYIVVKLKDLSEDQLGRLESRMDNNDIIPVEQALVIESDWPEFEPAYRMIEARMAGQPTEVEQLRALSVSNIMLEVVPGEDGMGEEVYAKSVTDIEALLTKQFDKEEELEEKLAKALEDVKAANATAETMRVQKEDFMKLSDERFAELKALKETLKDVASYTRHPDYDWHIDVHEAVSKAIAD